MSDVTRDRQYARVDQDENTAHKVQSVDGTSFDVEGLIKWFDPVKGFGFVVPDDGGSDILLHVNVLRNFGQSSVADGARVGLRAVDSDRGRQATELTAVIPPFEVNEPNLGDLTAFDASTIQAAPLEPARVKWFDKSKGFGFANVFGSSEDVFLHVEVLRRSGLSDVQSGEALALKVLDGKRGKMAAKVQAWESVEVEYET